MAEDRRTPVTVGVEYTEAEAAAAAAAIQSVLDAVIGSGALPPGPLIAAGRKLALARADALGIDVPDALRDSRGVVPVRGGER